MLTIPGLSGSGPDHWQTAWDRLLPATRVHQSDWDAPRYAAWAENLSQAVSQAPSPPILIAHSLGCILVTRWLAASPPGAVAGAFLVAPVDRDRLVGDPRFDVEGFDPVVDTQLPTPSAVVASCSDEWCDVARARLFAQRWGSVFFDAGDNGHLGTQAALGDWPQGLGFLRSFLTVITAVADSTGTP